MRTSSRSAVSGVDAQRTALFADERDVVREMIDRLLQQLLERPFAFAAVNTDSLPRLGGLGSQDPRHLSPHCLDHGQFTMRKIATDMLRMDALIVHVDRR